MKGLFILTSVMICISFVIVCPAQTLTDSQGLEYTVSDDGTYCVVSGFDGSVLEVVIPQNYDGYPVTAISDFAFSGHNSLKSVFIPDTVTSIGYRAFHYCMDLDNLIIGDSVAVIDEYAFSYCFGLTNLTISDSVTEIGSFAFYFCQSLPSVTVPSSVAAMGSNVFDGCVELDTVYCEAKTQPSGWNTSWDFGCDAAVRWNTYIERGILGDVEGDGDVDQIDYLYVKRAYFGTYMLSTSSQKRADVDKNGTVDQMDYMLIKRAYFGTYDL